MKFLVFYITEFVQLSKEGIRWVLYIIRAPVHICVVIACRMAVSTITVDSVIQGHHVYKDRTP